MRVATAAARPDQAADIPPDPPIGVSVRSIGWINVSSALLKEPENFAAYARA